MSVRPVTNAVHKSHRQIFAISPSLNFHHRTVDVGNDGMDLCNILIHIRHVVIHPGNDGMGI